VRVSNELGADQPHRARFAVVACTAMVMNWEQTSHIEQDLQLPVQQW